MWGMIVLIPEHCLFNLLECLFTGRTTMPAIKFLLLNLTNKTFGVINFEKL